MGQIAADLLPGLLARDSVDFVAAFAQPFCFSALCAFLGWPPAMAERLRGWTHGNQEVAFSQDRAAGAALARAFTALVTEAIRARREAGAGASADLTTEPTHRQQLHPQHRIQAHSGLVQHQELGIPEQCGRQ